MYTLVSYVDYKRLVTRTRLGFKSLSRQAICCQFFIRWKRWRNSHPTYPEAIGPRDLETHQSDRLGNRSLQEAGLEKAVTTHSGVGLQFKAKNGREGSVTRYQFRRKKPLSTKEARRVPYGEQTAVYRTKPPGPKHRDTCYDDGSARAPKPLDYHDSTLSLNRWPVERRDRARF